MRHFNLFYAAARNIERNKTRGLLVISCLSAILVPFISALALLEGVRLQAGISVESGADIYLTMDMYGRNGMVPAALAGEIKKIDGVVKAVPRVAGRIYVEGMPAVLLGLPAGSFPPSLSFVKGGLPDEDGIVVGRGIARKLGLDTGSRLSIGTRIQAIIDHIPYVQKKVYTVSGIFDAESSIWTSNLILMDVEEAVSLFEMEGFVTDIAVFVKENEIGQVVEDIQRMNSYFRIQTKAIARKAVVTGFNRKGGLFTAMYVVAFATAIPLILMISGYGFSERKKEIGILKVTGWQTYEVLEMVFFENMILSLIAASLSFILSYVWVRFFNAPFIGGIFIAGAEQMPAFTVPALFSWMQLFLSFFFSIVLTLSGSIYSSWKTAVIPPAEAVK